MASLEDKEDNGVNIFNVGYLLTQDQRMSLS